MNTLKKIMYGIVAALSTPEAVRAEKSLLVIVLVRLAVLVPSAAWVVDAAINTLR